MKKMFLVLAGLSMAMGCQTGQQINADAEEKAVKAVLDDYVKSIDDEDMDLYARVMSNDSDMVDVGGSEGPFDGTLLRIESADSQGGFKALGPLS